MKKTAKKEPKIYVGKHAIAGAKRGQVREEERCSHYVQIRLTQSLYLEWSTYLNENGVNGAEVIRESIRRELRLNKVS